jgi:benzil reductase ((S)-benzoin forming)
LLDLNKTGNIQGLANTIFEKINDDAKTISLINNAGMLAPVRPVEECSPEEIITNNNVNLVAPMILSSLFIKFVKNFNAEKRIINISSGAGKYPINGWSSYCTSKSGIDMFTQCCALEQDNKEGSVKVLSFAPGIVDTDMQKEIRSMSSENFPEVNKFIEYKEKGHLLSPEYAAGKIAELLFSNDFIQGDITRIK